MDDVHRNDASVRWIHVVVYAVGRNRMKAILVVDIPDKHNIEELRADIQVNSYGEEILDWRNQTLIPMPHKNKYYVEEYATFDYENNITLGHYLNKGWNECIDEILGETE